MSLVMTQASDTAASDIDSVFGDAEETTFVTPTPRGGRKRQSSVPEMVRALEVKEQRKSKRVKHGSKEGSSAHSDSHSCRLDDVSLAAMKDIMDAGIAKALKSWTPNTRLWRRG